VIPYARQSIDQADIDAVVEVLRGDWLTQGPAVGRFESALAAYCGAQQAVAVSSGTAALHLACRVLDLGPGDWLWTSPMTFLSSANCALFCGARVDFVDVDPQTQNLCPGALEDKLRRAESAGRLPKIVVPVHFAGQPCDLAAIHALAQRYGFHVVEDAAHALGARYADSVIGDCRCSDITVFSFHPVKSITTGEGGALLTNRPALAERARRLRSHGVQRDLPGASTDADRGAWHYEQTELGYNYRMTDIQAALGEIQLRKLDGFVAQRQRLSLRYDRLLADLPLRPLRRHPDRASACHLYPVRFDGGAVTRRRVYDVMHRHGIGVQVHYIPVHLQPFYRGLGFRAGDYPTAEHYYAGALSLPLYPELAETGQNRVVALLAEALAGAGEA
jgi:UDP-4-amino-4,6-dideoxy-N-acetyl-beta-L-altrosamine transaminase